LSPDIASAGQGDFITLATTTPATTNAQRSGHPATRDGNAEATGTTASADTLGDDSMRVCSTGSDVTVADHNHIASIAAIPTVTP
jgi:hypothetical protein